MATDTNFTTWVGSPGSPSMLGASDINRLQSNDLDFAGAPRCSVKLNTQPLSCPNDNETRLDWQKGTPGTWDYVSPTQVPGGGRPSAFLVNNPGTQLFIPEDGLYLVIVSCEFDSGMPLSGIRRLSLWRARGTDVQLFGKTQVSYADGNDTVNIEVTRTQSFLMNDNVYATAYQNSSIATHINAGVGGWNTRLQVTRLAGPT